MADPPLAETEWFEGGDGHGYVYQYIGPIHYLCECGANFLNRDRWLSHKSGQKQVPVRRKTTDEDMELLAKMRTDPPGTQRTARERVAFEHRWDDQYEAGRDA